LKRLLQFSLLVVTAIRTLQTVDARPVSGHPMQLTVCVMNDGGVTQKTVQEVEKRVDLIFADSAIAIQWILGGDPNRTVAERWACGHPEPLRIVILRWMQDGKSATPKELGETFLGANGLGVVSDVFLKRTMQLGSEREVNFAALLALVTAHELGHLLLGPESHSHSGLMRAKISEDSLSRIMQGSFGFTREEDYKMYARMKSATMETSANLIHDRGYKSGK
jgi:hypothetical protein